MDRVIDETIDLITRSEYTPERSLAVDALVVMKELVGAKRMDRVLERRSDGKLLLSPLEEVPKLSGRYSGTLSNSKQGEKQEKL